MEKITYTTLNPKEFNKMIMNAVVKANNKLLEEKRKEIVLTIHAVSRRMEKSDKYVSDLIRDGILQTTKDGKITEYEFYKYLGYYE